jgi:carboxymethylenebutenolidase
VEVDANRATYKNSGVNVSGYFYQPQGNGPFPAVLVLHGKSGLGEGSRAYASWLAMQGYVAFAPDYFTPIDMTPEKFDATFYQHNVDQTREHLAYGLEGLRSLPYIASNRIGVVGHSLGGYLAFMLATRDDLKGIVSYYGAYAPAAPARYPLADLIIQIRAPVLMFHGDKDDVVPIAHANRAEDVLKRNGKQYEYIIYPGVGHNFDFQSELTYDAKTTADSQQKVLAFFKAKL